MSSIHESEYRKIIERLKKARKEADLTQEDVARKLCRPQSYVSKIETYQRRMDILELKEFAVLYGIGVSDLL